MDFGSSFSDTARKVLLQIFFPGIIVCLPFGILLSTCIQEGNAKWLQQDLNLLSFFSTAIAIIVLYGIGHIINKIGARVEVWLEQCFCCKKIILYESEFMRVFDDYLRTYFDKKSEPVIIRYYSLMVIGLKFELNTCVALVLAFIEYMVLIRFYDEINLGSRIWFLLILLVLIVSYLIYEAWAGIETLHGYRELIIKEFNKQHLYD